jgi:hypothetical protein
MRHKTSWWLNCFAFLAGLAAPARCQPASWDKTVSLEVRAPERKKNGMGWHLQVPVMLGPFMPSVGIEAPSMMLCIVDEAGAHQCTRKPNKAIAPALDSICPFSNVCNFNGIHVPSSGSFGILLVNLTWVEFKTDYMLGAVIRDGPKEDPEGAWKIERNIKALMRGLFTADAPEELPQENQKECTVDHACFGDNRAGVPSIVFAEVATRDLKQCGMPISGDLQFDPGNTPGSVEFTYRIAQNQCPGRLDFLWSFGDGRSATSAKPSVEHAYNHKGNYEVTVTPQCVRSVTICNARPSAARVAIGQ